MMQRAARAVLVAAGIAVALPVAAAPLDASCGGDKHGDEKKEKNPSVSPDPSCDGDHGDKKDKKGDDKS